MKKVSRKDIEQNTQDIFNSLLNDLQVSTPSKRTKKVLEKISKKFSSVLKDEVKKLMKKNQRALRKSVKSNQAVAA
jgi:hypothetical protein